MGRSKIDNDEDECLAGKVKQFLYLYDKNCSFYKDKRAKVNSWAEVDKDLGLEDFYVFILYYIIRQRSKFPKRGTCVSSLPIRI